LKTDSKVPSKATVSNVTASKAKPSKTTDSKAVSKITSKAYSKTTVRHASPWYQPESQKHDPLAFHPQRYPPRHN